MDETAAIRAILAFIEEADDAFMQALQPSVRAFDAALAERLAEFDRWPDGRLKKTAKNIRLSQKISRDLQSILLTPEYERALGNYSAAFDKVAALNAQYFAAISADMPAAAVLSALLDSTKATTLQQLTAGVVNSTLGPELNKIISSYISGQGRYADMVKALVEYTNSVGSTTLVANRYPRNFLSSYAYQRQVVTDTLNQFNGEYINTVASTAGFVWYQYVGSNITHTRSFCTRMTKKRWIHVSELPAITAQDWEGKIDGTNAQTFFAFRGGYNCRHGIYPVSDRLVPDELRRQFD